jgi:hypothetical protein
MTHSVFYSGVQLIPELGKFNVFLSYIYKMVVGNVLKLASFLTPNRQLIV